jgi:hypothetical protein
MIFSKEDSLERIVEAEARENTPFDVGGMGDGGWGKREEGRGKGEAGVGPRTLTNGIDNRGLIEE